MGAIATLFMYAIVIGVFSVVAYFVIKMAVKNAIKEYENDGSQAGMTNEEMKEHCEKLFPTLKRWKFN